jgi:hypothetical protein
VPLLARACGRTLLLAFLVLVITAAVPFQPRSLTWASQLSGRIVDTASFPLLGVALLQLATLLQPEPDPLSEPREAMAISRQRNGALRLCRLGVISLGLLAVWQIPLLFGSFTTMDQQGVARSSELNQRIGQGEQTIRQAPPAEIQREWQRLRSGRLTEAEVNQAWKRCAAEHHPDRGGEHLTMQLVNGARDLLLGRSLS